MSIPKLEKRIQAALGKDVRVFSEPGKLGTMIALMAAIFWVVIAIGYFDGSLNSDALITFVAVLPLLLAFTYYVGWRFQFRSPYMATGSHGVAFPLACREVIPWSNIEEIKTYSEMTWHGKRRERHVAIALKLKAGTLADYSPTWRSSIPIFGYGSHFSEGVILLSEIYCSLSPSEILDILKSARDRAAASAPRGEGGSAASAVIRRASVPSIPRSAFPSVPPGACLGRKAIIYWAMLGVILCSALLLQNADRSVHDRENEQGWVELLGLEQQAQNREDEALWLIGEAARQEAGKEVPRDLSQALELYRRAADLGSSQAMIAQGLIYAEGDEAVRDPEMAHRWFTRAADAGDSDGFANLGWIHQEGIGVAQSYELAHVYFKKAVERGNAEAMNRLGLLYADGLGTKQDPAAAMRWFEASAEKNNPNGINNMGWLYRNGLGVPQDLAKARSLFERAANMGNEVSAWSLSILLDEGKGGPPDPINAAARLLQAAKAGQADAIREFEGTMEHWTPAVRREIKVQLAIRGFYGGALDDVWDEPSRTAARLSSGRPPAGA